MAISLNSPKYADVNSLAYQMHKKQQDRKKRRASIPEAITRYFRRNLDTTDYARFAAPITLAGDFSGSIDFLTTNTGNVALFSGDTFSVSSVAMDVNSGNVRLFCYNSSGVQQGVVQFSGAYNDGVLHTATFSFTGTVASLSVDGGTPVTGTWSSYDTASIGNLYRRANNSSIFDGILANLKIWDNGTLITDCPIDEPSGATIIDHASGNNATIINGLDADRGPFKEEPALWKGQNLTVPPWDSVDQELLKA